MVSPERTLPPEPSTTKCSHPRQRPHLVTATPSGKTDTSLPFAVFRQICSPAWRAPEDTSSVINVLVLGAAVLGAAVLATAVATAVVTAMVEVAGNGLLA